MVATGSELHDTSKATLVGTPNVSSPDEQVWFFALTTGVATMVDIQTDLESGERVNGRA